ncbi:MAG TPA: hypothetical protein P5572_06600, partial [Phycisphaerae bacterium]|nr:hypothetical protein [Phycisphaerae bacterium]
MSWKRWIFSTGVTLLCAGTLFGADADKSPANASGADRLHFAPVAKPVAGQMVYVAPTQADLEALKSQIDKARERGDEVTVDRLSARLVHQQAAMSGAVQRGPATCGDCSSADSDANLDPLPTTVWGGSASGDCGVNGHWMAEFTANFAGERIHFDLCNVVGSGAVSTFDADIKILDNGCTILGGVDGASSCSAGGNPSWNPSDFQFVAPAAGTYYAVIAPYDSSDSATCDGTSADTFTVKYYSEGQPAAGPANDDCGGAEIITNGVPAVTADNCNAGADLVEASCQSNSNLDMWYEYTADCTGTVTIDTEGSAQSDTVLTVFDSCGGSEIACDDDGGTGTLSNLSFETLPGETYLIRVASYNTGCGGFDLNVSCTEAPQGACCDNGVCSVDYELNCAGKYLGDGTNCDGNPCAQGACCFNDGGCRELVEVDCITSNGTYQTDGSTCTPNECPQPCSCDATTGGFCTAFGDDVAGDFGLWTQSTADDRDWTLLQGATTSSGTGPTGDHTTGSGFYAYFETSSPVVTGDVAILDGPCVDLSTLIDPAMTFWYHMLGAGQGTLDVQVSADNCLTWDTAFSVGGNQGDQWNFAQIDLAVYAGQTIHVRFVGTCGPIQGASGDSFTSDMAIDDVCFEEYQVLDGACCDVDTGACLGNMSEGDCANAGNTSWHILQDCVNGPFSCPPSPVGDDCSNAIQVTLPADMAPVYTNNNTTCGRGNDFEDTSDTATCMGFYTSGEDIFYELTVTAPVCINATLATDTTYSGISIDAACPPSDECNGVSTSSATDESIENVLLFPGTYSIMIDTFATPACINSLGLTLSPCATGACCSNGVCSITTQPECLLAGGNYVGDGTDCSNDPCSQGACCAPDGTCSLTTSADCALAGGSYRGDGTTCDSLVCNDDCADAIVATNGMPAAVGDNCNASDIDDAEASCQSNSGKDVWYSYVAECTGTVTVDTEGSDQPDTVLTAFDGCGGAEIACDDDGGTGNLSVMTFDAIAGNEYLIRLASFSDGCGTFGLNIACDEAAQGACCTTNGVCSIEYQAVCEANGGSYGGDNTMCAFNDCDASGIDDACDVIAGSAADCNGNLIPDECDVNGGGSNDCNVNGIPDECETDCNTNGIADECDIAGGTSSDCQPDGIPDDCQLTVTAVEEGFENDIPGWTQVVFGFSGWFQSSAIAHTGT